MHLVVGPMVDPCYFCPTSLITDALRRNTVEMIIFNNDRIAPKKAIFYNAMRLILASRGGLGGWGACPPPLTLSVGSVEFTAPLYMYKTGVILFR